MNLSFALVMDIAGQILQQLHHHHLPMVRGSWQGPGEDLAPEADVDFSEPWSEQAGRSKGPFI